MRRARRPRHSFVVVAPCNLLPPIVQLLFSFGAAMDDNRKDANVHLKIVKVFLHIVGLWPYDDSWVVYVKRFMYMFTITTEFVFQLLGFLDEENTRDNIVNFVINALLYVMHLTRYMGFMLNIANLRALFDTVETQRNVITDPEERKIMYAQDIDTDRWNRVFTSNYPPYLLLCEEIPQDNFALSQGVTVERIFSQVAVILHAVCLTSYNLLGIYSPNSSAPGITLYYFSNDPKLSYVRLLHMIACTILPCFTFIGFDSASYVTTLHAVGLFRITKHRCDVAFEKSEGLPPVERQKVETQNIMGIAELHQQGAQFVNYIHSVCSKMYYPTQVWMVVATSLCMLRAHDRLVVQPTFQIQELLVHLAFLPMFMYYGYIVNNICQMCLDTSGDIFWSLSDAPWYKGTVASQKMILFLLQHCQPIGFNFAGGLYQANLEGFGWNIKLAFSYFTLVSSV